MCNKILPAQESHSYIQELCFCLQNELYLFPHELFLLKSVCKSPSTAISAIIEKEFVTGLKLSQFLERSYEEKSLVALVNVVDLMRLDIHNDEFSKAKIVESLQNLLFKPKISMKSPDWSTLGESSLFFKFNPEDLPSLKLANHLLDFPIIESSDDLIEVVVQTIFKIDPHRVTSLLDSLSNQFQEDKDSIQNHLILLSLLKNSNHYSLSQQTPKLVNARSNCPLLKPIVVNILLVYYMHNSTFQSFI